MGIKTGTLWNVKSATIGGDWVLDAWGGLLKGIIYIDRTALSMRNPSTITATLSDGTTAETEVPDFDINGLTIRRLPFVSTSTLVAFRVDTPDRTEESRGLWQADALYTVITETEGDFYTKEQINGLISQGVSDSERYTDRAIAGIQDDASELRKEMDGLATSVNAIGNATNATTDRLIALEVAVESMSNSLSTVQQGSLSIVEQGNNTRGSWIKFSNGAMKQWGVGQSNPYGNVTQLFAQAFPKAPTIVQAVQAYSRADNTHTTGVIRIEDAGITTVSFNAQTRDVTSDSTAAVTGVSSKFYWFAEYWPDATFKLATEEEV